MGYAFCPGVHGCNLGGVIVLLDLPRDRYLCLEDGARGVCLHLVEGAPCLPDDADVFSELIGAGLLFELDGDAKPSLCDDIPCSGSVPTDRRLGPIASIRVIAALARIFSATIELRLRSLDAVLAGLAEAKKKRSPRRSSKADLATIAASFAKADRLKTALDLCLPRSIAIARTLVAYGFTPTLVLAVKLRPFEAHCWVQSGDVLVGDDVGTIAPFTPIFIL